MTYREDTDKEFKDPVVIFINFLSFLGAAFIIWHGVLMPIHALFGILTGS